MQPVQQVEGLGGAGEPPRDRGPRPAPQHHLAQKAQRAQRPDEQPAQVEAADVLHRGTATLDQPSVGRDIARLQQHVAQGALSQPPDPAVPYGQHPADGRAVRPAE